jgi:hypothetical protein
MNEGKNPKTSESMRAFWRKNPDKLEAARIKRSATAKIKHEELLLEAAREILISRNIEPNF